MIGSLGTIEEILAREEEARLNYERVTVGSRLADGTPVTIAELREAFEQVCNPDDWKAPIYDVLDGLQLPAAVAVAAVEFFTATECQVCKFPGGFYSIKSIGYRCGPAGDH